MKHDKQVISSGIRRRDFGAALGAGSVLSSALAAGKPAAASAASPSKVAGFVKAGFAYPPTAKLDEEGYYSWPGSSFDAEKRQEAATTTLDRLARELRLRLETEREPIDTADQVRSFIDSVKRENPDGLLLFPYKKSHVENVISIIDDTGIPTVVYAPLGVLLNPHIRRLSERRGVRVINSSEEPETMRAALKLIQTRRRMQDSTIVDLAPERRAPVAVPHLGTRIVTVPLQDFYDIFAQTKLSAEVKERAQRYLREAVRMVEPTKDDVYEAAKCYFVLKEILNREQADALMMTCLPGLKEPHRHVPPCMGFMDLRDEGIPAGCESDLDATLTMMLLHYLFDKPGFQHNPAADTENSLYFGAHCTSASKMHGVNGRAEPYALRSHAEAGWGCVPQVLFATGEKVTFAKYHSRAEPPEMVIYGGTIAGCPPNPPCGGCRTNMQIALRGLDDPSQVKSHHLCMCYGEYETQLQAFCEMFGIRATA